MTSYPGHGSPLPIGLAFKTATLQAAGCSTLIYVLKRLAPVFYPAALTSPVGTIAWTALPFGIYAGVTGLCLWRQPEVRSQMRYVADQVKLGGSLKYYTIEEHASWASSLAGLGSYLIPVTLGALWNAPRGTLRLLFAIAWAEVLPGLSVSCFRGDRFAWGIVAVGGLLLPFNKWLVLAAGTRHYVPKLVTLVARGWRRRPYKYKSPDHDRTIRLLESRPGILGPKYRLKLFNLDSAPPFEAISYRWGSNDKVSQIKVEGMALGIPQSAYDVLSQQTSPWRRKYLWIDAICINQEDDVDKTQQVLLMKEIFGKASRVIIWLGAAHDSMLSWYFFSILVEQYQNNVPPEALHLASVKKIRHDNPKWAAFNRLLENPYWSRVWIVQEIAVAQQIDINYGGYWWDWRAFIEIVEPLQRGDNTLLQKVDIVEGMGTPAFAAINQILNIENFRKQYQNGKELHLTQMLLSFTMSKASLEVDHVYAFQGISTAAKEDVVVPDYTKKSTLDVYEEAAVHSFNAPIGQDRFLLLSIAGLGRSRSFEFWPSWMPDFEWISRSSEGLPQSFCSHGVYYASGVMGTMVPTSIMGPDHNHEIKVFGTHIDEIVAVTELPPAEMTVWQGLGESGSEEEKLSVEHMKKRNKRAKEAQALAEAHCPEPYFTGQSRWEAFWRTQIGNLSPGSYPAAPEYGEYFKMFFEIQETAGNALLGTGDNPFASPPGFTDLVTAIKENKQKATPEETLDTIQQMLDPTGALGGVRQHLSPELLVDRIRLFNELASATTLPYGTRSEIMKSLKEEEEKKKMKIAIASGEKESADDAQSKQSPELAAAWMDLMCRAFDPTRGEEALFRGLVLFVGLIYGDARIALTPEQISSLHGMGEVQKQWALVSNQTRIAQLISAGSGLRHFAVTKSGYMALVPLETQPGDLVSLLIGARTPHVLRKAMGSHEGAFRLLGEAYLHGFMDGQAFAIGRPSLEALRIA